MKEVNSPWLTVDEGAAYCRKGRTWFRQQVRGGKVKSYDVEGITLLDRDELNAWIRSHPSGACEAAQALQSAS